MIRFIAITFIYAILWEGATYLVVFRNPSLLFAVCLTYLPILIAYYVITKLVLRKTPSLSRRVAAYLICGGIGLFGLEWGLMHNSPQANQNANQIAMFCYWGSIGLIPYLMQDTSESLARTKSMLKRFFLSLWLLSWVLGGILPMPARFVVVILMMIIGYVLMNGAVYVYIMQPANSKAKPHLTAVLTGATLTFALIEQVMHSMD